MGLRGRGGERETGGESGERRIVLGRDSGYDLSV